MGEFDLATVIRDREAKHWCLFLDRDGVINTRIIGGYVRTWTDFQFTPGALGALRTLAQWAPHIAVVTNQQGVGKAVMSSADLTDIHDRMREIVGNAGGRIDDVLSCTHLVGNACDCRKPEPGLASAYLDAHTEIDGALSIMIGDTSSDIEMGNRLAVRTGGCVTVRIQDADDPLADVTYPSIAALAAEIDRLLSAVRERPGYTPE